MREWCFLHTQLKASPPTDPGALSDLVSYLALPFTTSSPIDWKEHSQFFPDFAYGAPSDWNTVSQDLSLVALSHPSRLCPNIVSWRGLSWQFWLQ